jgi:hypothetical protein
MRHGRFLGGSVEESWSDTEVIAKVDAANGQFAAADSVLAGYALRHPGTPEALETAYWRAVYALDPQNRSASLTDAMASLDGYLASPQPRQHVVEATTLRRIAAELQDLHHTAAASASEAREASKDAANAKAEANAKVADAKAADTNASPDAAEVRRLRDELAKANAELERIKKRLAAPTKPPR